MFNLYHSFSSTENLKFLITTYLFSSISCASLILSFSFTFQGVPFRTSHDIAGKSVALCTSKNCQLLDLSLDELRSINPVFEEDVYDFLGVENAIQKFVSYGSTGSSCVASQIDYWMKKLEMK